MKKLFTMFILGLMTLPMMAQVAPIQTSSSPYDYVYSGQTSICINKKSNKFSLFIHSDNEFESATAIIQLGVGTDAAVTSLRNLRDAINQSNVEFTQSGYSFFTLSEGECYIHHTGSLQYTAGDYRIMAYQLETLIWQLLIRDPKAKVGSLTCTIEKYSNYTGVKMKVHISDMKLFQTINLIPVNHMSDIIEASVGDILTDEQVMLLYEGVRSGAIRETDDSRLFKRLVENK